MLVALAGLALAGLSCGGGPAGPGPAAPGPELIRVEDDLGRPIHVPSPANRVVAFSPGTPRYLEGVGAEDRLVGVGPRVPEPGRARVLERMGDAVLVSADLVLADRLDYEDWVRVASEDPGVPIMVLDPVSLEEVTEGLERLGLALEQGPQARAAVAGMRQRLDRVRTRLERAGAVNVHLVLSSAARPPWLEEQVRLAGGAWIRELGEVQAAEVAAVVLVEPPTGEPLSERLAQAGRMEPSSLSQRLAGLPAVDAGHVYRAPGDLFLLPGPQLALGVELLAHLLHPFRVERPRVR